MMATSLRTRPRLQQQLHAVGAGRLGGEVQGTPPGVLVILRVSEVRVGPALQQQSGHHRVAVLTRDAERAQTALAAHGVRVRTPLQQPLPSPLQARCIAAQAWQLAAE